jgi:phage FluMu protein Com
MSDERYIVMTVECSRCKTKQKVHVALRTAPTQMANESIRCLDCDKLFKAKLPDKIVDGPFPM